ncbi:hypothetical protein J14TS2_46820 [Bacillus sp. J14TS2]|uniref:hypothetical protein n=1 Tax=Bacillus sp. J14TS2 TaxID=2807188 RepID=UPI001B15B2AE|nr:hypothetical protein [Bacillus sp. J14TS2]GIN74207.1 hypothetical protein J14TS2_46820 [Bacillus sp. J14TS2]
MKKFLLTLIILLLTSTILIACNNKGNSTEGHKQDSKSETTNLTGEAEGTDENATETVGDGEGDSSDSNDDTSKVTEEDQTDLKIGDTGTVQTSIGTYELTVDSAEIVGPELDGVSTELEELIVLDLTFKNVDDQPLSAEDIMSSLGITDILEGSNNHNSAEAYESIDDFEGELASGEERKTQFIADVYTAEEYYFRQNPGIVAAGTSNDVMWTITAEEARK